MSFSGLPRGRTYDGPESLSRSTALAYDLTDVSLDQTTCLFLR